MLYLVDSELSLFAGQSAVPSATAARRALIQQASAVVDETTGRSKNGLGVHSVFAQIPLDLNFSGELPDSPFIEWVGTTGEIITVGLGSSVRQFTLSDFDVDIESGIVKATRVALGGTGFEYSRMGSPFAETVSPNRSGTYQQIDGNPYPYSLSATFKAGYFIISSVSASAAIGDTSVDILDPSYVSVGDQFYFDTDPVNAPDTDTRFVTDINGTTISFTPALEYALPSGSQFRKIDLNVRRACGIIVGDLIQFPSNTIAFSKSLGRGALSKSWRRSSSLSASPSARGLLGPYTR
jgi:hypothetical protein